MKTRTINRLPALFLALLLVLCLVPVTVSAHTTIGPIFDGTTSGSLTVNKTDGAGNAITDNSLAYTIYPVATVQQTNTGGVVSTKYILAAGISLNSGAITGDGATVAVPSGVSPSDFDTASLTAGTTQTNIGGTGTLTFSGLPLGLYLVRETVTPAGVTQANDFLVSIPLSTMDAGGNSVWDYDPVAAPKNTVVDGAVSKTLTAGGTAVSGSTDTWTASLGSTLTYQIQATLPTTFTTTPFTTYTVTDTPDAALIIELDGTGAAGSFNGVVVTMGGTTLVNGLDYTISSVAASGASGIGFEVELITDPAVNTPLPPVPGSQSPHLGDGAVVTVTYDAQLSPLATGTSFTNAVKVNNEYLDSTGTDITGPEIEPDPTDPPPTILSHNYALKKVDDSSTPVALAGAVFAIQDSANNYLKWTSTGGWGTASSLSDPDLYTVTSAIGTTSGIVSFNGLAAGSYSLVEIAAPSGYSVLTTPISVTIDATSTADADTAAGGAGYSIQVVNSLANTFVLPGTGGRGIYLYTIGGVLLIAAAILLIARNRKKNGNI